MKRLAPLTLLLVLFPALALAGTNPRDETEHLKRADMTLAKRAAVRKSDLVSSWRLVHAGPPKRSGDRCTSFDPDLSRFVITGKQETSFAHGTTGAQLVSDIGVFRSVKDAAGDFKASATRGFLTCLKGAMMQGLRAGGMRGKVTTARMAAMPRIGAQSASYRVVATVSATSSLPKFHMYADVIVFRQGRSQGALLFMAPLAPVQGQAALARSVANRLK